MNTNYTKTVAYEHRIPCEHCIPTQPCINCTTKAPKHEPKDTVVPARKCIFSGSGNRLVNHWYP